MKIVNLQTFRALPEGTIFLKYEPCCFDGLQVKGETLEYDFLCGSMVAPVDCDSTGDFINKLDDALVSGTSVALDFNQYGRDGCFNKDQLFAVYERDDMQKLIAKLQESVEMAYAEGN